MLSNDTINFLIQSNPQLKQGFYEYKDLIYFSKIEALIAASKDRGDIRFVFNDHVFSNINWQNEPTENLEQLYHQRAKQIRENYDHVVLMYSGGSDSNNVLHSFLQNDILPDEIWSILAKNYSIDPLNDRSGVEIIKSAYPNLKIAEKKGVKIKLQNMLDHYEKTSFAEDWFLDTSGTRLSSDQYLRKSILLNNYEIKKMIDAGKKVCYVFGFDKPRIRLNGNMWSFGILDTILGFYWKDSLLNKNGPFFEYFYLTPDFPKITIKSVHRLINAFEKTFSFQKCKEFFCNGNLLNLDGYNKLANDALYSHSWNANTFSLGKNKGIFNQFYDQKASFLYDKKDHWNQFMIWSEGIKEVQSKLDSKFFTNDIQITGHWGAIYPIKKFKNYNN